MFQVPGEFLLLLEHYIKTSNPEANICHIVLTLHKTIQYFVAFNPNDCNVLVL